MVLAIIIFYLLYGSKNEIAPDSSVVTLYFADNIADAQKQTIKRFNKKYAGRIKVEAIDLPFEKFSTNERKELLTRSLRSKSDKLDIFTVDQIWISRFSRWTVPLDEVFTQNEINRFEENTLEPCYVEGKLHSVPLYFDIGMMYYREDLIKRAYSQYGVKIPVERSMTWEEFVKYSRYFDEPYYIYPAESYEGLICSFIEMILNQNRNFFKSDTIDLTKPEAVNAANLLVDMVHKLGISPREVTGFKEMNAYSYFFKNEGVFLRGWPGLEKDILRANRDLDTNIAVYKTHLPHFKGTEPAFIIGGWNLMISKYSRHKKEAMIFLKYLVSEESQVIMFDYGNYLPVKKEIYDNDKITKQFPELGYYKDMFQYGVHRPFLNDYTRVSDIMSYYLNKAIKKDLSVEEAMTKATNMINEGRVLIK